MFVQAGQNFGLVPSHCLTSVKEPVLSKVLSKTTDARETLRRVKSSPSNNTSTDADTPVSPGKIIESKRFNISKFFGGKSKHFNDDLDRYSLQRYGVPVMVDKLCRFLENHAANLNGVYLKTSKAPNLNILDMNFSYEGMDVFFALLKEMEVEEACLFVAQVIKNYFNSSQINLIGTKFYQKLTVFF